MEYGSNFKVKVISATDLEDVRQRFRMKVYAEISISIDGVESIKLRTNVDKHNGTNTVWNSTVDYKLTEGFMESEDSLLVVRLFAECTMGNRFIGEVKTPIKKLFEQAVPGGGGGEGICTPVTNYKVCKDSIESLGEVAISCSFGEKIVLDTKGLGKKLAGHLAGHIVLHAVIHVIPALFA